MPIRDEPNPSRRLRRFYIKTPLSENLSPVRLDAAETHHLRDIIRLAEGDRCLVTDGRGWEAEASVREFARNGTTALEVLRITRKTGPRSNKVRLRVLPVLLQKGKTDALVEKAQELGVDELWPLTSARCEVRIPSEKIEKTVARWRKIAAEASKQSGALKATAVAEPLPFKEAVQSLVDEDALVVFHPGPDTIPLARWIGEFRDRVGAVKSLNLLIGPEGGFTEDEIDWLKWRGKKKVCWVVGLGDTVLKADTAFIGTIAAIRFLELV